MALLLSLLVAACIAATSVSGHSYHLGSCPAVEPVAVFDMSKFLGKWYVVQKTSTASACLFYDYTPGNKSGEYLLEQVSEHFALGLTSVDHKYRYTGQLTVKDRSQPAKMTARFPLSLAGSAQYVVFATDYDNYAAVFTCQRLGFAHRQSTSILSRRPIMDKTYLDKLRMRMTSAGIDPFELSVINQTGCAGIAAPDGYDINIDPDTLSAGNIAGVVRTAGEKVGDGIEYVAGGAKKVYNKLGGGEREREDIISADQQAAAVQTEWLP